MVQVYMDGYFPFFSAGILPREWYVPDKTKGVYDIHMNIHSLRIKTHSLSDGIIELKLNNDLGSNLVRFNLTDWTYTLNLCVDEAYFTEAPTLDNMLEVVWTLVVNRTFLQLYCEDMQVVNLLYIDRDEECRNFYNTPITSVSFTEHDTQTLQIFAFTNGTLFLCDSQSNILQ